MRRLTDASVIHEFFGRLNRDAHVASRVYLTGGACAVLLGWRSSTIDIDMKLHAQDRDDVESMLAASLVAPDRLLALFAAVEPNFARYPAVNPAELRRRLEALAG